MPKIDAMVMPTMVTTTMTAIKMMRPVVDIATFVATVMTATV